MAFDGFAAHEGDDFAGGVERARQVALGDGFLEHLAEHFGVDGDFLVVWGGFGDGEVVALEEVGEYGRDGGVGDFHAVAPAFALAVFFFLSFGEKAAVQKRDFPDEFLRVGIACQVFGAVVVQSREKQGAQASAVKVVVRVGVKFAVLVFAVAMGVPKGAQVIGAAVVAHPAFALGEVDEHQPVEQVLGEHLPAGAAFGRVGESGDGGFGFAEHAAIVAEERLGDRLHAEGVGDGVADGDAFAPEVVVKAG